MSFFRRWLVMLNDYEVPVARSAMQQLDIISLTSSDEDLFIEYIMLWIAFNNIYVTLANQKGIQRKPKFNNSDNSLKTFHNGTVELPEVTRVTEREQINIAYEFFSDEVKDELIKHKSTMFFVNRKPKWNGKPFGKDHKGQIVNGVINLGFTYSEDYLYWSPIDKVKYNHYISGDESPELRDDLSYQIVNLLYTIRNNTFHGGKRFDDANDREVIKKAIPLLKCIVTYFCPYLVHTH